MFNDDIKSMENQICQWERIKYPDSCRDVEIMIGVDEAGRGVLFYYIAIKYLKYLKYI